jgi:hypothetical protein
MRPEDAWENIKNASRYLISFNKIGILTEVFINDNGSLQAPPLVELGGPPISRYGFTLLVPPLT